MLPIRDLINSNIIQQAEILKAPMPVEHKELVLQHWQRLKNIVESEEKDGRPHYLFSRVTDALEGLARMTLVHRDYSVKLESGEIPEEVESMAYDMLDACLFSRFRHGSDFFNPVPASRKDEIILFLQEFANRDVDDPNGLFNRPPERVVEEEPPEQLTRRYSDSTLHRVVPRVQIILTEKDKARVKTQLLRRNTKMYIDKRWPLTPGEMRARSEEWMSKQDLSDLADWRF